MIYLIELFQLSRLPSVMWRNIIKTAQVVKVNDF